MEDNLKCLICKKKPKETRKCPYCSSFFCYSCLINYYEKGKNCSCLNCYKNINVDEYEPILAENSDSNSDNINDDGHISLNFRLLNSKEFDSNDHSQYCFECQKIFDGPDYLHKNHHFFSLTQMSLYDLNTISEKINLMLEFKKLLEIYRNNCSLKIHSIEKTQKLYLKLIENLKNKIQTYFEKEITKIKSLKDELEAKKSYFEENLNIIFDNISQIIKNTNSLKNDKIQEKLSNLQENKKNSEIKITELNKNICINFQTLYKKYIYNPSNNNNNFNESILISDNTTEEKNMNLSVKKKKEDLIIEVQITEEKSIMNIICFQVFFQMYNFSNKTIFEIPLKYIKTNNNFFSFVGIIKLKDFNQFFQNNIISYEIVANKLYELI